VEVALQLAAFIDLVPHEPLPGASEVHKSGLADSAVEADILEDETRLMGEVGP